MKSSPSKASVPLLVLMFATTPATAQSPQLDQNIFVLGGRFQTGYIQDTFRFWEDHYEDNFFAGVGYQNFLYHYGGFKLGAELGLGLRAGQRSSLEAWVGAVARYDGLHIGDLNISPGITAGFSLVTDTIGIETVRAAEIGRGVPLLFYLGPEVAVSYGPDPQFELLARVHHRSGGFGTIAPIDGSNAATLGLRWKF